MKQKHISKHIYLKDFVEIPPKPGRPREGFEDQVARMVGEIIVPYLKLMSRDGQVGVTLGQYNAFVHETKRGYGPVFLEWLRVHGMVEVDTEGGFVYWKPTSEEEL